MCEACEDDADVGDKSLTSMANVLSREDCDSEYEPPHKYCEACGFMSRRRFRHGGPIGTGLSTPEDGNTL